MNKKKQVKFDENKDMIHEYGESEILIEKEKEETQKVSSK